MPTRRYQKLAKSGGNYRQNHGRPGVVYILENPGLRIGWWKIGCSMRSGLDRARDLNVEATTGTPGVFQCVYEYKTLNCGLAEERVFVELADARRGKRGQEYFEVDRYVAEAAIERICGVVDREQRPPPPLPPPPPALVPVQTAVPPQHGPAMPPPSQAVAVAAPRVEKASAKPVLPAERTVHPERFCGYCRTLVIPLTRLLFMKYCPRCQNPM